MYNKTTLKKIKKDELVQMYLDLQAKNYDEKMEEVLDKCCTNAINETVEELKKENESLKEERDEQMEKNEDLRWWVKKILSKMAEGKEDPIKDVMNETEPLASLTSR